ncbi:MAG: crotonase/enoyl-CoA hydratase family protein [Burkholderiales bacterium]
MDMTLPRDIHRVFAAADEHPIDWLGEKRFSQFDVEFDADDQILFARMRGTPVPNFNAGLLAEAREIQRAIEASGARVRVAGADRPFRYVVLGSSVPGVFSLGGDLGLFMQLIRARDRAALERYGRECVDVCYHNVAHYHLPVTTISLVQGEALGGGMESALSSDIVIAERSAKFGLPEVLFGLFPGMGAYNLIGRRLGRKVAEEMILSGATWSGEELYAKGLVDVLAADGQGENALHDFVRQHARKANTYRALQRIRDAHEPVRYEDLLSIVNIWCDTALELTETQLKLMERLVRAQAKRMSREDGTAQRAAA